MITAAAAAGAALQPAAGRDWVGPVGSLEWDVERTITHPIGATAKYTLYLASRVRAFHRPVRDALAGRDQRGDY